MAHRYVVLRITELGYSSCYTRRTVYERVELSVWDGRVLARCSLGAYEAEDTTTEGDWVVTERPSDPGCTAFPDATMTHPRPLLHPGVEVVLVDGALTLQRAGSQFRILADRAFVASRLGAMLAAERSACETQPQGWPMFGGCMLAEDITVCTVDPTVWSTDDRVFFQILCDDPNAMFTDLDASRTWLAVGRQFWDAHAD